MSRSRRKPYYKDGTGKNHRLYRRLCRGAQSQDMRRINLRSRVIDEGLMEDVDKLNVREYSEIRDDWHYNDIVWYKPRYDEFDKKLERK